MNWGHAEMKQKEKKRHQVFIVHLGSLQVKGKRRAFREASIVKCVSCLKYIGYIGSVRRNALIKKSKRVDSHSSVVPLIHLTV